MAIADQTQPVQESKFNPSWKIKLLYDGECPLCVREVKFLLKRDAGRGIVNFVDIADPNYNPEANAGVDFATAMGRIHGILPDGTVIKNVEVFRRVYEELGMGWVYALTKLPAIRKIADIIYGLWADWRLQLTGRPSLAEIMATRSRSASPSARSQKEPLECNSSGRCQGH